MDISDEDPLMMERPLKEKKSKNKKKKKSKSKSKKNHSNQEGKKLDKKFANLFGKPIEDESSGKSQKKKKEKKKKESFEKMRKEKKHARAMKGGPRFDLPYKNEFDLYKSPVCGYNELVKYEEFEDYKIDADMNDGRFRFRGVIYIGNYMMYFDCRGDEKFKYFPAHYWMIPYPMIQNLSKKYGGQFCNFTVLTKDCRSFNFRISDPYKQNFTNLKGHIDRKNRFPHLYAFKWMRYSDLEDIYKGWNIYDAENEFMRQGCLFQKTKGFDYSNTKVRWRLVSNKKKDGKKLCKSYPDYLMIPSNITYNDLKGCIKFRSKNRFPAMSYFWSNSKLERGFATLWRSAQCCPGLGGNRSTADEFYIYSIHDPTSAGSIGMFSRQYNPMQTVHIYDARPKIAAMGNRFSGKGYESSSNYKNCEISFNNIENAPTMQSAFKKISNCIINYQNDNFMQSLASSDWFTALARVLTMSNEIINSMVNGITPLIHCSDGWDRTSQVASLVQLLIDPYFRTIHGFSVLVEKEWVHFGHQFAVRNGIAHSNEKEKSPIFLQFCDCVHQIFSQNPTAFEFNLDFLRELVYMSYTGSFGNLICDNMTERRLSMVHKKTVSIWSYLMHHHKRFKNPFYEYKEGVLRVNDLACNMRFWKEYYFQYAPKKNKLGFVPTMDGLTEFYKNLAFKHLLENEKLKKMQKIEEEEEKKKIEAEKKLEESKVEKEKKGGKDEEEKVADDEQESVKEGKKEKKKKKKSKKSKKDGERKTEEIVEGGETKAEEEDDNEEEEVKEGEKKEIEGGEVIEIKEKEEVKEGEKKEIKEEEAEVKEEIGEIEEESKTNEEIKEEINEKDSIDSYNEENEDEIEEELKDNVDLKEIEEWSQVEEKEYDGHDQLQRVSREFFVDEESDDKEEEEEEDGEEESIKEKESNQEQKLPEKIILKEYDEDDPLGM